MIPWKAERYFGQVVRNVLYRMNYLFNFQLTLQDQFFALLVLLELARLVLEDQLHIHLEENFKGLITNYLLK